MTNAAITSGEASALLAPCPACGKSISVDADACPGCGRGNDWIHPRLLSIVEHLRAHHPAAVYEVRGHRIAIEMKTQNLRQKVGMLFGTAAVLLLICGFFSSVLMGLSILSLAVGGLLTAFGLSAFTNHAIQIDIRQPNPVVAVSDANAWASIIALVR